MDVGQTLSVARERGASDAYIDSRLGVALRVNARIESLAGVSVEPDEMRRFLEEELDATRRLTFERRGTVAFEYAAGARNVVSVTAWRRGPDLGIDARLETLAVPSLDALGLPPAFRALLERRDGLVIVGGPAHCDKRLVAAAALRTLLTGAPRHAVVFERGDALRCVCTEPFVRHAVVGRDVAGFSSGVRAAARAGAEIVVVASLETSRAIAAAAEVACQGTIVIALLRAPASAIAALRCLNVPVAARDGAAAPYVAESLRGVLMLRKLPALAGGLVRAAELLIPDATARRALREGRLDDVAGWFEGAPAPCQHLEVDLARLIDANEIVPATALHVANAPDRLRERAGAWSAATVAQRTR